MDAARNLPAGALIRSVRLQQGHACLLAEDRFGYLHADQVVVVHSFSISLITHRKATTLTLYCRNDIVAVTVSPDGHGGCGRTHSRPAPGGKPENIWALTCDGGCEDHLRKSTHWSPTIAKIPETFDEESVRKDFEQRGALDERKLMAMALARLTGLEIPETIAGAMAGRLPHIPVTGQMVCPSGHSNPPGKGFCGDCGQPMHGTAAKTALPAPVNGTEAVAAPQPGQRPRRLRDARSDELKALALARGLSEDGTRADLIARLAGAGVTSADLARLPVAA